MSCGGSDDSPSEETPMPTTIITISPVKTTVFSEITTGGKITKGTDNATISEKGVCWSTSLNPSINDNKLVSNSSSNDFLITIDGLVADTRYYIRAYFIASSKTVYGDEQEITTDKPTSPVAFLPSAGANKTWTIQAKFTNEFNYEGKSTSEFTNNWEDKFFNGWTGARPTYYSASQSTVTGGEMVYKATIDKVNGEDVIRTGVVSSKEAVGYPMYMEARVKISESVLASAVWMLSSDSAQEIDNLEAYGDKTNNYFSQRLHLSHHTFKRSGGNIIDDYQPSGQETYYADGKGTKWADDYHDYGVLWLDPWTLKYYVDGELVRETPTNQIDPRNNTDGTGLNKDMYLIISAASQPWREKTNPPQVDDYFTNPSVLSDSRSTMRIDYIRTYKPQ
ncbi:hypothetical protein GCM10023314_20520 [Algibacter agarivorans]|uniref:GH16 domain-containing protein n=1 Tax=Algibacter agarivorans TaxID=1109741 RepID=A0ABP9GLM1_9FLAO